MQDTRRTTHETYPFRLSTNKHSIVNKKEKENVTQAKLISEQRNVLAIDDIILHIMEMRNQFGDNDTDGGGGGEQQCRACLVQHSKHHVYSMDSKNHTIMDDGSEETIAEIYHQCTQLLYDPADCHYNWICQYCIEKMVDFVQFRKMCINSYNTLKQASQTVTMTKNNSLKVELMDEYDDAATCGMEMDHTVAIKQEASFDCNASQSKDQNHEFNPNDVHMDGKIVCVGWEMPLPQAAANAQVQAEKHVNETEDGDTDDRDTDFVGFGDTSDDSSDSDDMAENKATNKKQVHSYGLFFHL